MGFLLEGIDVDRLAGNHLGDAGNNAALVFYGEAQVPASRTRGLTKFEFTRTQEPGNVLGVHLASGKVAGDFDQIRNDRGPRGIASGAASIKHLGANLVADQEHGVVDALRSEERRV